MRIQVRFIEGNGVDVTGSPISLGTKQELD